MVSKTENCKASKGISNKLQLMKDHLFINRYAQSINRADDYKNIKPLSSLVLEYANIIHEEDADAIKYVNRIQQDLFDKGIIPFMVTSVNDRIKVDEMPYNEIKEFLNKVLLAYRYKDGDRWRNKIH